VSDFKQLKVWRKAHALSLNVHRLCVRMRPALYASLRTQMFRAAMSISANIAEGRRQNSDANFRRFLGYALNSASELEHHLIVARDVGAMREAEYSQLVAETITVRKMLYRLIQRLSVVAPSNPDSASKSPRP
jgi:four helix bundle protein